jgi:DNA-binding IclR family transcriptional regulator
MNYPQRSEEIVEEKRDRGYAIKDTAWRVDYSKNKNEYDDGLGAIATPMLSGRKVLGCVNLAWIARLFNSDQIARKNADRLKVAALKISSLASPSHTQPMHTLIHTLIMPLIYIDIFSNFSIASNSSFYGP